MHLKDSSKQNAREYQLNVCFSLFCTVDYISWLDSYCFFNFGYFYILKKQVLNYFEIF